MPLATNAEMNRQTGTTPGPINGTIKVHSLSIKSNCPILPPSIAPLPACPKPSFVRGPKSSIPKVEDVSIWLLHPASALRVLLLPPLLALSPHFLLPLLRPYLPPSLQGMGSPFTPFFLLSYPTPAPERLSAAIVRPKLVPVMQLHLKVPGDLALLAYSVVLFSFLRLMLSHTLFPMLARRWGIWKVARFGEQVYAVVGVWRMYTTPASSALKSCTPHFWLDRGCPELPFPVRMQVCASTGGSLAGDAGSAGRQSLTCQVALRALFLGLACRRFAVRGPHAHAF
ncbi:hypothetical protein B0H13DRAFT_1907125 [Mycena leptocephala]|nr:hypothetical protein B0H13DRAFT_1907125 [Mycena leptocephala]